MCKCQGNPLARVTLALGLPYLLVNRALLYVALCCTMLPSLGSSVLPYVVLCCPMLRYVVLPM